MIYVLLPAIISLLVWASVAAWSCGWRIVSTLLLGLAALFAFVLWVWTRYGCAEEPAEAWKSSPSPMPAKSAEEKNGGAQ